MTREDVDRGVPRTPGEKEPVGEEVTRVTIREPHHHDVWEFARDREDSEAWELVSRNGAPRSQPTATHWEDTLLNNIAARDAALAELRAGARAVRAVEAFDGAMRGEYERTVCRANDMTYVATEEHSVTGTRKQVARAPTFPALGRALLDVLFQREKVAQLLAKYDAKRAQRRKGA